jgi:hypothetical protein
VRPFFSGIKQKENMQHLAFFQIFIIQQKQALEHACPASDGLPRSSA